MSKYVKNLMAENLAQRLRSVNDALLVNMVGLSANNNNRLRGELATKNIHVIVVKNSLAARATVGTPLEPMFKGLTGASAVCWGSEDIVSLTKQIVQLTKDEKNKPFEARGGVVDGEVVDADTVMAISRWPSRLEQLSILSGQILSPGANLVSQLIGIGGELSSQIEQKSGE
ncbi:MAG: 50S ribosomal protein L10 [Thermoguttaceae bacterium]